MGDIARDAGRRGITGKFQLKLNSAPCLSGYQHSFPSSLFYSVYSVWVLPASMSHTQTVSCCVSAVNLTCQSVVTVREASPFYGRHSQYGAYCYL